MTGYDPPCDENRFSLRVFRHVLLVGFGQAYFHIQNLCNKQLSGTDLVTLGLSFVSEGHLIVC